VTQKQRTLYSELGAQHPKEGLGKALAGQRGGEGSSLQEMKDESRERFNVKNVVPEEGAEKKKR